ncbi:hypothetical protein DOTSEDRAFT_79674 [Dothistroma septosporum NZE10]|uniref:F-box domain-containing protein n=1 Tax=Dothistroma septosporum (strain NZE10 / CBS 128990) TaxID=675120 RepID=N1PR01_DOTSN|nr:hypothetical protein DOTSEDRAFT_79674 [Dothistroma septosporum NZE10]
MLDALSNELFERVVCCLPLDDIRSLRLVSRATAYKATQDKYRSCFRSKRVELTRAALECMVHTTADRGLGSLVENLTLVGIVYNTTILRGLLEKGENSVHALQDLSKEQEAYTESETKQVVIDLNMLERRQAEDDELRASGTDRALLTEAFTSIAASTSAGLKSLSLQIAVYRDDASNQILPRDEGSQRRRSMFEAAARAFTMTMSCLRASGLSVQALNIFAKKPESLGCNLPCDSLRHVDFGEWPAVAEVRTLSIGIADRIVDESVATSGNKAESGIQAARDQIDDDASYSALSKMIAACQNLENLDISAYQIVHSDRNLRNLQRELRPRYVHHLTRVKPLCKLRSLRLAGLMANTSDLASLLSNHSSTLHHLSLMNIRLTQGSWTPLMALPLTMNLETIHLEDLHGPSDERSELVEFEGELTQHYTVISGHYAGRESIKRQGIDARKEIPYHFYNGRAIGAPRVWKRTLRRREEFGGR